MRQIRAISLRVVQAVMVVVGIAIASGAHAHW